MISFINQKDYMEYMQQVASSRLSYAQYIAEQNLNTDIFYLYGVCDFCEKPTKFMIDWRYGSNGMPNYRERMVCSHCGLNNRQRFVGKLLNDSLKNSTGKTVYIYEQVTPFFLEICKKYSKIHNIIGSEYLGFDKISGAEYAGVRHEDAMNLSFIDDSVDIMVSQDVLEHVPNYHMAISESHRVLKKDGVFILSIPFNTTCKITIERARMSGGEINFLLEEIYHGNPVDEKGSLVFFDFGWDVLDLLRQIGFVNVGLLSYYDELTGHIGGSDQFIFFGLKKSKGIIKNILDFKRKVFK